MRPLKWTRTAPGQAGLYWLRSEHHEPTIVEVAGEPGNLWVSFIGQEEELPLADLVADSEWSELLQPPISE